MNYYVFCTRIIFGYKSRNIIVPTLLPSFVGEKEAILYHRREPQLSSYKIRSITGRGLSTRALERLLTPPPPRAVCFYRGESGPAWKVNRLCSVTQQKRKSLSSGNKKKNSGLLLHSQNEKRVAWKKKTAKVFFLFFFHLSAAVRDRFQNSHQPLIDISFRVSTEIARLEILAISFRSKLYRPGFLKNNESRKASNLRPNDEVATLVFFFF